MCICRDGKPADCTQYDCGLQHPGCTDKHGIMYRHGQYSTVQYSYNTVMYRHGQFFVPKGDCNSCYCNNGTIGGCTERACPQPCVSTLRPSWGWPSRLCH